MKLKAFATILFLSATSCLFAQTNEIWNNRISKADATKEIDTLYNRIISKHVNPFWKSGKLEYEKYYKCIRECVTNSSSETFDVEELLPYIQRLIAFTGDIHSSAHLIDGRSQARQLPFFVKKFHSDSSYDFRITTIDSAYKNLLGFRLLKVGNYTLDEALSKIQSVLPRLGGHSDYYLSRMALRNTTLLHSLHIISSPAEAELTLTDGSTTILKKISAGFPNNQNHKWAWLDDQLINLPFSKKHRQSNYWYEYLPNNRTMFLRWKQVSDNQEQPFMSFTQTFLKELDSLKPLKVIIDIRDNTGGNNFLVHPLVIGLKANSNLNQYGKLFCIMNGLTFSAAISFLQQLDSKTNVITIGETAADAPNFCSDIIEDSLPISKLKYGLSAFEWINSYAYDSRKSYTPDEPYNDFSWSDYTTGTDKLLQLAINYSEATVKRNQQIEGINLPGKYRYSSLKPAFITQVGSNYVLTIPGEITTQLSYKGKNTYGTGMSDLMVKVDREDVITFVSNGKTRSFNKISVHTLLPYELVKQGKISSALPYYSEAKAKGLKYLQPNNLSTEAFQLFLSNKEQQITNHFIQLNKSLNPTEKFSEYIQQISQRFYQTR